MTDQEFADILNRGRETSGVEFKGPGALSNGRLVAQIVRAVLAMANRQGGGIVIIGIEDEGASINPVGLGDSELAAWTYDNVADQIARYADPGVKFDLNVRMYNGRNFLAIEVEEFFDIPIICKRDNQPVLRRGACYVRTRRKPETSEIPTQTEMRELLDLAISKGVSSYLERARQVGLYVPPGPAESTGQELFRDQRRDLP